MRSACASPKSSVNHPKGECPLPVSYTHLAIDDAEDEDGEAASLYDKLENKIAPLYARPNAWARVQQHCIGINGAFFNTHRMLGQYFNNAYFPQMSEEQAVPIAVDLLGGEKSSVAVKESALV